MKEPKANKSKLHNPIISMRRTSAIIALIFISFLACVDVEDVLPPFIDTSAVDGNLVPDTVYYQDTIRFSVSFSDNVIVDSTVVAITPLGTDIADSVSNWIIFITENDTLRGSRNVTRNIEERVPAYITAINDYTPTGKYVISLFAIDKADGVVATSDTFLLCDDVTPPVFDELSVDLEIRNGNLFTCPGFTIPVSGKVSDNTQLRRIGYYFNNETPFSLDVSTGEVEYDTIDLSTSLDGSRSVVVPDELNNQTLTLTIFAEDIFRNTTEQSFTVEVDCDTKGPDINIVSTSPSLNDENVAYVVTDNQFTIDSLVITDESAIDSVEIYFSLQGSTPVLYKSYSIDPPTPEVLLGDLDNLIFPSQLLPFTQAGLTYVVTIRAYDTVTIFSNTGNVSENIDIELITKEDDPVEIPVIDLILNEGDGTSQTFQNADTASTYTISIANDLNSDPLFINHIIADGKAEDDVGIQNLTMEWINPNNTTIRVTSTDFDPAEAVIKLRDYHDNELAFDDTLTGIYILVIKLTDAKRTTEYRYKFELTD